MNDLITDAITKKLAETLQARGTRLEYCCADGDWGREIFMYGVGAREVGVNGGSGRRADRCRR